MIHITLPDGSQREFPGPVTVAEVAADASAGATLQIQKALSDVQDLDYAEASTRLAKNLTGLQAVQETFSRLSNLSLFNYLR